MDPKIIITITGVLLLVFAGYKIWKVVQLAQKISASKMWPAIAGDVVSKKVKEHWTQKSGKSYHPEITVKYTIMGQEYEKTISLPGIFSQHSAEKALGEIGASLEVRYNPENPAETVAEKEKVNITDLLLILACLGLAIYTIAAYFK